VRRLREVLRNEYIGAIAIGFLLAQSAGALIGTIMRPVEFYVSTSSRQQSVFGFNQSNAFPWPSLFAPLITFILYLVIATLLMYWLYWHDAGRPDQPVETTAAADQFE